MKIAVISPSTQSLTNIGSVLEQGNPGRKVTLHEGGITRLRAIVEQSEPDVAIVEGLCRDPAELGPIEYVTTKHPQLVILLLCSQQTPEFLINAMRAGVREVLPSPISKPALEAAIARTEAKRGVRTARPSARVLAMLSCKGGGGATFLATNVGYQLASEGKRVLLIDLNLQYGEALLSVHDRKATSDIAEVARNLERLDASFLSASTAQVAENYEILSAPDDPAQSMQVRPEHLDAILNVAANQYDFIVLDLNKNLDDLTLKALDRAHGIYLVVQTALPHIRNADRLLGVFRSLGYPQERIELLVNRYGKGSEISLEDVRASLGPYTVRTIPNNYPEAAKAINQGRPVASFTRSSALLKAIADLAASLAPKPAPDQSGLLWRLRGARKAV